MSVAYRYWQCTWTQAIDGQWHAECGVSFAFHTSMDDHDVSWCWHCGGRLVGMDRTRVPRVVPRKPAEATVADLFEEVCDGE